MNNYNNPIRLKIQDKVIPILMETSLCCGKIAKIFGCSRGPIWRIQKENSIIRPFDPGRKHFPVKCKLDECENSVTPRPSINRNNRGKFCCKEHYRLWQKSEENCGELHPNWVDGGKHEDYLNHLRKSDEWREWRTKVFERDDYTCQMCNERGLGLHPHHIRFKSDFPELIYEVDNGITLCVDCHRSKGVHSYDSNLFQMFIDIVAGKNEAQLFHHSGG